MRRNVLPVRAAARTLRRIIRVCRVCVGGTSLPGGGSTSRAALTAHRRLANACMFTDLGCLVTGDRFTIEVFGEVLRYRVIETKAAAPEGTASLWMVDGRDLVTPATCTRSGCIVNDFSSPVSGSTQHPKRTSLAPRLIRGAAISLVGGVDRGCRRLERTQPMMVGERTRDDAARGG